MSNALMGKSIKNQAFTIIELLVVVVIIGVLVAAVTLALSGTQRKSRDARRVDDFAELEKAVKMYHTDNYKYPGGTVCIGSGNAPSKIFNC